MISSIDAFRCTQVVKDKKSWFFCAILAMWPYIVVLHITRLECSIPRKPPVWRDLWFIQLGSSQVGWEGWNRLSYTYTPEEWNDDAMCEAGSSKLPMSINKHVGFGSLDDCILWTFCGALLRICPRLTFSVWNHVLFAVGSFRDSLVGLDKWWAASDSATRNLRILSQGTSLHQHEVGGPWRKNQSIGGNIFIYLRGDTILCLDRSPFESLLGVRRPTHPEIRI